MISTFPEFRIYACGFFLNSGDYNNPLVWELIKMKAQNELEAFEKVIMSH